ncbi:MAG TPA: alpha/beta hydrolase [Candidatus Saccharimonadales bacterium]|nr:alpha/beta hydrolase [Candidatus Saccharimonadales bacterium]
MSELHPNPEKEPSRSARRELAQRALGIERPRITQTIEVDGRSVEYYRSGDRRAHSIFFLHGSPGHCTAPLIRTFRLHLLGVEALSYSRPGYGRSDRHEGRRIVDEVARIEAIADQCGIETFSVVGRSGGGPSALATATLLPDRVKSVAVLAGPTAPRFLTAQTEQWSSGMSDENTRIHDYAARHPEKLREEMIRLSEAVSHNPRFLIDFLRPQMHKNDIDIVDSTLQTLLLQSYRNGISSADHTGWLDDTIALHDDWGFEIRDIETPTLLWYAENDPFCPPKHGVYFKEHMPSAHFSIMPNSSHFDSFRDLEKVVAWVRDSAGS